MLTDLQYRQKHALANGVTKYGKNAAVRAQLAQQMRKARKTFPADLIMSMHNLPAYIKAERKAMRAYAVKMKITGYL